MICHSIAVRRGLLPCSLAAPLQNSQPASIAKCSPSLRRYQRANLHTGEDAGNFESCEKAGLSCLLYVSIILQCSF